MAHAIQYHQDVGPHLREEVLQFGQAHERRHLKKLQAAFRFEERREARAKELSKKLTRETATASRLRVERRVRDAELARWKHDGCRLQNKVHLLEDELAQANETTRQAVEAGKQWQDQLNSARREINDLRREVDECEREKERSAQELEACLEGQRKEVMAVEKRAAAAE